MENTWQNTTGLVGGAAGGGDAGSRLGRELHGQELRWFLTVKLVEAGRPMRVRELVSALGDGGFAVAGRASKVISDCLRWEISRRRVRRLGRGVYQAAARIPRTTLRRLRSRVAEFRERQPAPVRTQPQRPPRPLVSPGGPKRLRRRHFTTANKLRAIRQRAAQNQEKGNGATPTTAGSSTSACSDPCASER